MWQDLALSVVGIIFTISLIPQLIDVRKHGVMNSITCCITTAGCCVIAIVDMTLNLPYSSAISVITAIIWGLMLYYSNPMVKMMKYVDHIKYKFNLYLHPRNTRINE